MTMKPKHHYGEYRNMKAEIARQGVTQTQIAEGIGMSRNNFNLKINGRVAFSVPEVVAIRDSFLPEASLDYLLVSVNEES
jgi:hypothetical protein